jgi:hypothetical protein
MNGLLFILLIKMIFKSEFLINYKMIYNIINILKKERLLFMNIVLKREFDKKALTRIVLVLLVCVSIIIANTLFNNKNTMTKNGFITKILNGGMYEIVVNSQIKVVDIGLEGWTNEQTKFAERLLSMKGVKLVNYTVDGNGFLRPKAIIVGNIEAISAINALSPN